MWFPRLLKISVLFAPAKKVSVIEALLFIVWSPILCVKEEILPIIMEPVENPSMETNSKMKISNSDTPVPEFWVWLMPDPTPMVRNFSFVLPRPPGLMASGKRALDFHEAELPRRKLLLIFYYIRYIPIIPTRILMIIYTH